MNATASPSVFEKSLNLFIVFWLYLPFSVSFCLTHTHTLSFSLCSSTSELISAKIATHHICLHFFAPASVWCCCRHIRSFPGSPVTTSGTTVSCCIFPLCILCHRARSSTVGPARPVVSLVLWVHVCVCVCLYSSYSCFHSTDILDCYFISTIAIIFTF